jgi:hypothetical protein
MMIPMFIGEFRLHPTRDAKEATATLSKKIHLAVLIQFAMDFATELCYRGTLFQDLLCSARLRLQFS